MFICMTKENNDLSKYEDKLKNIWNEYWIYQFNRLKVSWKIKYVNICYSIQFTMSLFPFHATHYY